MHDMRCIHISGQLTVSEGGLHNRCFAHSLFTISLWGSNPWEKDSYLPKIDFLIKNTFLRAKRSVISWLPGLGNFSFRSAFRRSSGPSLLWCNSWELFFSCTFFRAQLAAAHLQFLPPRSQSYSCRQKIVFFDSFIGDYDKQQLWERLFVPKKYHNGNSQVILNLISR